MNQRRSLGTYSYIFINDCQKWCCQLGLLEKYTSNLLIFYLSSCKNLLQLILTKPQSMQKQKKLSYIVSRIRKHDSKFPQPVLKHVNKVFAVEPSKENIPDILSIFISNYRQKCQQIKSRFSKNCYRGQDFKLDFDLIYKNQHSDFVHPLPSRDNKGQLYRYSKFNPSEVSKYLQASLQINEIKTKSLQQCLIELLTVIQSFQQISINKAQQKSSMNRSSISELIINQFQDDKQLKQTANQSLKQIKNSKSKQTNFSKAKDQKLKFTQAEAAKQSNNLQKLKASEQEIKNLTAKINDLQTKLRQSETSIQSSKKQWEQANRKYEQISNQINRNTIQIEMLQKEKATLQKQKQSLKQTILDYKVQKNYYNQSEQYHKQELRLKQQMIDRLQTILNDDQKQQKQIAAKQTKQEIQEQKHVVVLQMKLQQKEQEIIQLKQKLQALNDQLNDQECKREVRQDQQNTIVQLNQQINKKDQFINRLKEQNQYLPGLGEIIAKKELQIQTLKSQNREQQNILSKNQLLIKKYYNEIQSSNQNLEQSNNLILKFSGALKQSNDSILKITEVCQSLENEKLQFQQRISKQVQEKNSIEAMLKFYLNQIKELVQRNKKETQTLKQQIAGLKQENMELKINQLRLNQLNLLTQQLKTKATELQAEKEEYKTQTNRLQNQLQKVTQTKNVMQKDLKTQFKRQKQNLQTKLQQASQKIQELTNKLQSNSQKTMSPVLGSTALTVSHILEPHPQQRELIIRLIEKFTGKPLSKSELKYKYDEHSLNFSHYLNKEGHASLILFKLAHNNHIVGVFSTCIKTAKSHQVGQTFLFTLQNGGRAFYRRERGYDCGAQFSDNMLIFGNNELSLKSNSSQKCFRLNANLITSQYFNILSAQSLIGFSSDRNQVQFKEMELHRVYY